MTRSRALLVVLVVTVAGPMAAQRLLVSDGACDYYSSSLGGEVYTFKADMNALRQIDSILAVSGGSQRFETSAANVTWAAASIKAGERVVLYNQALLARLGDNDRGKFMAILAHQVGHHFFRHQLSSAADRRNEELEADKFSATVLRLLGASQASASSALRSPHGNVPQSYPDLSSRLRAVEDGWNATEAAAKLGYSGEDALPRFDIPPPLSSAAVQVPFQPLSSTHAPLRLRDVAGKLANAANRRGYNNLRYWGVRDGFAVATGLEQIDEDGSPREAERWSTAIAPPRIFSLSAYLNALFSAKRGRYRLFVFVVSPHPFAQRSTPLRFQPSIDWLWTGLTALPPSVASLEVNERYACTALIYEFEQRDPYTEAVLRTPSSIDGRKHLEMAQLWRALNQ